MFGLFQSVRTKGSKAAIAAVQPLLGVLSTGPGIPPGMWDSPYVLGFVNQTVLFVAKLATDGQARGADLGGILLDVYTAVTHQNGTSIMRTATTFMTQQHPEFIRGVDDAMLIQFYGQGTLRDESSHPILVHAKAGAAQLNKANDKGTITGLMMMATWLDEVEKLADQNKRP